MTDVRHVIPRVPFAAKRYTRVADLGSTAPMLFAWWMVTLLDGTRIEQSDSEFAANFFDAAVLSELVDAARVLIGVQDAMREGLFATDGVTRYEGYSWISAWDALRAALAAFDAVMLPDRGK